MASDAMVKDSTERVDIRAAVNFGSANLFRRAIRDRTQVSCLGRDSRNVFDTGNPEVAQLHPVARNVNVGWFHITMHNAAGVSYFESARDLCPDSEGVLWAHAPYRREKVSKSLTLHKLHDHVMQPIVFARTVDTDDVRRR